MIATKTTATNNRTRKASKRTDILISPFTILADNREQHPFTFTGFKTSPTKAKPSPIPIAIPVVSKRLQTGDYTIESLESEISIERKSHDDLYQSLTHGRDRFRAELERMQSFKFSAVVVECGLSRLSNAPPDRKIRPKSILRSIQCLSMEFPTQWYCCPSRRFAEEWTWELLDMYWRRLRRAEKQKKKLLKQQATG